MVAIQIINDFLIILIVYNNYYLFETVDSLFYLCLFIVLVYYNLSKLKFYSKAIRQSAYLSSKIKNHISAI